MSVNGSFTLDGSIQEIEYECHDENVFLKAERSLSNLNFLFYLKL